MPKEIRASSALTRPAAAVCVAAVLLCTAYPAAADYVVGAGGTTFVANGLYDLACTDLIVAGTLNLDSGRFVNVRDVLIASGGVINGGTGSITYSRDFTVSPGGQFNAQGSALFQNTACGPGPVRVDHPIPTLGNSMLIAVSGALALLAMFFLGGGSLRRRDTNKGAGK